MPRSGALGLQLSRPPTQPQSNEISSDEEGEKDTSVVRSASMSSDEGKPPQLIGGVNRHNQVVARLEAADFDDERDAVPELVFRSKRSSLR